MQEFDPHKTYMDSMAEATPVTDAERIIQQENMLQLEWFVHRCQSVNNEGELEARLQQLAKSDPNIAEQIERSTLEEKQTIILNQMIINPQGFPEAGWFRVHFPSDKGVPLAPAYKLVLDTFETDPEGACAKLDELFREGSTTH